MITRDMAIEEIFTKFPQKSQKLAQEMTNFGLHCIGCSASTEETLEEGMYNHGMNDDAINALLERLNKILAEEVNSETIALTEKAAKKFKSILEEEGKTGWALRFGEKSAGCKGLEYVLDFSNGAKEDDATFESHGVQIHVQKKSLDRLLGSVIDYVNGLKGAGFKISNPNVKASCGCGNSHGY